MMLISSSHLTPRARLSSLDANSNYEFHPHMSLMYKKLPFNIKEKIIQGLRETLEFEKVSFDKIQIMTDSHDETREAVENWKIIEAYTRRGIEPVERSGPRQTSDK